MSTKKTNKNTEKKVKVGEKVENPNRAQVEEYLAEIGWSIRHHGHEHWYFYNHQNKCTHLLYLFPDTAARLEYSDQRGTYHHRYPTFIFYMKQILMEMLEDCVSFRGIKDDSIFILCANYEQKDSLPKKTIKSKKK
jgi:hypothetical protein